MERRARGSWPGTDTEIADRDLVVALVKRVGVHRLVFTAADVRSELREISARIGPYFGADAAASAGGASQGFAGAEEDGEAEQKYVGPMLHHSGDLWRHLAALDGDLIAEVGRRDFGQLAGSGTYGGRKKYALRTREHELAVAAPAVGELDDLERVQLAAWVAFRVASSEPIPTNEITRVLQSVEPLSLTKPTQTYSLLQALAVRTPAVVEKVTVQGERWVRWRPLGPPPEHEDLDTWVEGYAHAAAEGINKTGKATLNEVGRELVCLAVRSSRSSTYPHGHSVRPHDVRAVADQNERAKLLAQSLRRRSRGIAAVITDAARETIGGVARVDIRIARIVAPLSATVYYDVPDEPGFDQRVRAVALQDLRNVLKGGVLERIEEEVRMAEDLADEYPTQRAALHVLIAARILMAQREFGELDDLLRGLERHAGEFSKGIRQEIHDHRARMNQFLGRSIWNGDEEEVFEAGCVAAGLDPVAVLSAARPLVTPDEYASWFSTHDLGSYTAAEFMWLAVPLRRFMNPSYTHRHDPDRQRAYRFTTDRVEALPYAASRLMAQSSSALAAGARLLGRNMRSTAVLRLLASSPDPALRRDTLAALVLLRENVGDLAAPVLNDRNAPAELSAETIMLLHLDATWDPSSLPERLRRGQDWTVGAALREVMLARSQGRRIV